MSPKDEATSCRLPLGALLLMALVLMVYRPVLPGTFLMDDWRLIEANNPLVTGQFTPFNIWFQTDFTLSSFVLWLEHAAWGHAPGGYHVVNLLLHGLSAVLIWRLLAALKVPGAWLGAALFAVHPVCVNSVARIAEIKNTLSLPFFLLSFLAYLHYEALALYPKADGRPGRRSPRNRATAWYAVALLGFVAALLAKTSTVMLPLLLVACAAWQRERISRQDWLHTAPFFALALGFGLMSVWYQKNQALASAGETLAAAGFLQRFALAGHALAFYLGKAWLPVKLSLVYPKWQLHVNSVTAYLPHLAFGAGAAVCWWFRRGWGRHVLFALGCYAIALFPSLGFFDSQFLVLWQVSDHLQYLPLVAPLALAAAAVATLFSAKKNGGTSTSPLPSPHLTPLPLSNAEREKRSQRLEESPPRWLAARAAAATMLVVMLSVLAWQRAGAFASEEKLMRDCIAKNPQDWSARNGLGTILAQRNDIAGAMQQFETAFRIQPEDPNVNSNFGHALAITGKPEQAETHYRIALARDPANDNAHKNLGILLQHEGRVREAVLQYEAGLASRPDVPTRLNVAQLYYQLGEVDQAKRKYQEVLRQEPDNITALNNLAWLLATCGDDRQRNGAEAVRLAEKACTVTKFKQAQLTATLAAAYAEAGRFSEAVEMARKSVQLATEAGDRQTAAFVNQLLQLYLNNQAYHQTAVEAGGRQKIEDRR